jgi:ATP:cob(I)alamin adenosyltransferase
MTAKHVGFSSLMDGKELPKSDFHFAVLGDLDECSSALALARSNSKDTEINASLKTMQKDLSLLMGLVAGVSVEEDIFSKRLDWIDGLISELKQSVVMPKGFIVPGETSTEAALDFARAVARRAERSLAHLVEAINEPDKSALQYLNRISTVLYLFELRARKAAG